MPRKIGDIGDIVGTRQVMPCRHPEHNPPMHMVYENGIWEHVCPGCGHRVMFVVCKPTL